MYLHGVAVGGEDRIIRSQGVDVPSHARGAWWSGHRPGLGAPPALPRTGAQLAPKPSMFRRVARMFPTHPDTADHGSMSRDRTPVSGSHTDALGASPCSAKGMATKPTAAGARRNMPRHAGVIAPPEGQTRARSTALHVFPTLRAATSSSRRSESSSGMFIRVEAIEVQAGQLADMRPPRRGRGSQSRATTPAFSPSR